MTQAKSTTYTRRQAAQPAGEYLNVDLEVRSRATLKPLVDALSRRLFVLHDARIGRDFFASFEVGGGNRGTPDAAIRRLIRVIDALPAAAARVWARARDRVFDIGVGPSAGTAALPLPLAAETVKAVARIRARVALTVYSARQRAIRGSAEPGLG